jgi:transcriptional regulator with XRE-family HTH domain
MEDQGYLNFIRSRRDELGMTQSDLADALRTTRDVVSSWELGRRFPLPDTRNALDALLALGEALLHGQVRHQGDLASFLSLAPHTTPDAQRAEMAYARCVGRET